MNRLNRDLLIEQACELINQPGHDITLNGILKHCGANKGSFYHFFPDGKDELIIAAVKRQAHYAIQENSYHMNNNEKFSDAIHCLMMRLAQLFEQTDKDFCLPFSVISTITSVENDDTKRICKETIDTIYDIYFKKLKQNGFSTRLAKATAMHIGTLIEGALLLARALDSSKPIRESAYSLKRMLEVQADAATAS